MTTAGRSREPAEEPGERAPGARLRAASGRALLGSFLAVLPFSIGRLIDAAGGTGATPLAADLGFSLIAVGGLVVVAALASIPVAVLSYLLERVVERVWLSRGGRLAAGAVAAALVGGGAGLALGGLVAPMWRPVGQALVFTGPWAAAAALLFLIASTVRRPRRGTRSS
ncbi:hypothetical protein [Rathayibacter festucae]|uniref:hypothetical protein n=1 Tax=Rathayibacter festucae TaxID=110937 RepID=UPI002A6A00A9|nr:hypothetical protein [Rathayibacter festucae]MDY0913684.1 hypothetical protein [Rathayibacter festucae]